MEAEGYTVSVTMLLTVTVSYDTAQTLAALAVAVPGFCSSGTGWGGEGGAGGACVAGAVGSGWFPGSVETTWLMAGGGRGAEGRSVGQAPCSGDQGSECGSQGYGLPWFSGTDGALHDGGGGPSVSAGTLGGFACAWVEEVGRGFWFATLSMVWTVSG